MKKKAKKMIDSDTDAVGVAESNCHSDVTEAGVGSDETRADADAPAKVLESPETLETLQAKVDKLADSLLRAKADYKNLERRNVVERSDAIRFANAELMRSLLDVLDDFERSLAAAEEADHGTAMMDGVRLIYDNLMKALSMHAMERIESLHKPFDPSIHEAMMQQPSEDHPPGTVLQELTRGYRLHGRVLRPARVIVSSASPSTAESDESAQAEVEQDD